MYPSIRISGTAYERGFAYGTAAKDRIAKTVSSYRAVYAAYAGLDWAAARDVASGFTPAIEAFEPRYLAELSGLAAGSGFALDEILAINCRTEIMFSGLAKQMLAGECSAFAALPERTRSGGTLIGQNWDWLPFSTETVVVLEVEQADRPNFVTVVEAGLLAKFGMNSAGLGLATNALVSDRDDGQPGVPYHLLLRGVLDCSTLAEAMNLLSSHRRASSANYLIASADGFAVDMECLPGRGATAAPLTPSGGYLAHTNHLLSPSLRDRDVLLPVQTDTLIRLQSIERDLRITTGVSVESLTGALRSHADYPSSVCTHVTEGSEKPMNSMTVASGIMDLSNRRMWLADGQPCLHEHRELDLSILGAPDAELAS
ncbi:C45 family peptidase [Leucobacter sp. M11]|uniref:C45 family peptidase n=1 Tax=Leucobacter sp. M11 TaxID=2993565 RepID=UPI002D80333A|nr:C45 family peptidase [Leucobacter sp. M11]MEB4615863.1 C45 family autoproteolytic acyltransferase/hydrolase [Leucobacter sp. M11]